jgi:hypothetical protein
MDASELNDRMVEIVSGEFSGFVGLAEDRNEHGWIGVVLDAVDPEDDRVVYPVLPEDVIIRPDLEGN